MLKTIHKKIYNYGSKVNNIKSNKNSKWKELYNEGTLFYEFRHTIFEIDKTKIFGRLQNDVLTSYN